MSDKKTLMETVRGIAGLKESRMAEVDMIMQDCASGERDIYDAMNNPKTPKEQYAAKLLQDMYDDVVNETGLHADDDFEKIFDIMADQLAKDYGTMENTIDASGWRNPPSDNKLGSLSHTKASGLNLPNALGKSMTAPSGAVVTCIGNKELSNGNVYVMHKIERPEAPEGSYVIRLTSHNGGEGARYSADNNDPIISDGARAKVLRKWKELNRISDVVTDVVSENEMKKYSKEVMEARKIAGLPLVESWDDDEDEDVKAADRELKKVDKKNPKAAAAGKQAEAAAKKVNADKDLAKLAKNDKEDKDDEPVAKDKPAAKEDKPATESKPASGGTFASIARPMVKAGKGAGEIRAALEKAGISVKHLHSRLHAMRKGLKEGFVLMHPTVPSFVLAENSAMNQYQWISMKDDSTSLVPMVFETKEAAEKVKKYAFDYKSQQSIITPVRVED